MANWGPIAAKIQRFALPLLGAAFGVLALTLGRTTFKIWPPLWASVVVVLLCAALVGLTSMWERIGEPYMSVQATSALVAIYSCVPEPERIPPLLAVAVAYSGLLILGRARPAVEATYPVSVALLAVIGFTGAANRPSAYVGVVVALVSMAVLPLIHRRVPSMTTRTTWIVVVAVGAIDLLLARTIGIARF